MGITVESGKVTGSSIGKNKDGTKDVILLQCEITDPEDIQTVELMNQTGEDNRPINGSRVTILSIGEAYKIAIASDDINEPTTTPGEKRTYATDADGNIVSEVIQHDDGKIEAKNAAGHINLLSSGIIEQNGNTFNLTMWQDLNTQLQAFIAAYNAHKHGGGSVPDAPYTLDITGARADTLKTGG